MPTQLPRLENLLGAAPHEADANHVLSLIASKAPEATDLDYKQANEYITGNEGAEELAKDVTGMAARRRAKLTAARPMSSPAHAAAKARPPPTAPPDE
jgi:hypothetical protein